MENIKALKQDLKNSLPTKGIRHIIETLKSILPENTPKHTLLLEFEEEYKEHKLKSWEVEEYADKARKDYLFDSQIIEFIDLLEEDDFNPEVKSSNLSKDNKVKKGHILYKVPQKMQLQKESKCIVRIAFDKEMLVEDLSIDEDTKIKAEIRISDSMKVEIDDSINPGAFDIRAGNKAIQFIDQDDFTQWRFFVKPLLVGEHILEIKVSIMLEVNGEMRVREKVLEESVVIVTDEVKEEPEFKKLPEALMLAQGAALVPAKNSTGGSASNSAKTGTPFISKMLAMGLTLVVAVGGVYLVSKYLSQDKNPIDDSNIQTETTEVTPQEIIEPDTVRIPETPEVNPPAEEPSETPSETENNEDENDGKDPNNENPDNTPNVNPIPPPAPKFLKLPPFKDNRDNKTYPTVEICGKVWMAENLKYKTSNSWCLDDKSENCEQLGSLYNWEAAKKACPTGWRLPSVEEWKELLDCTGGYVSQYDRNNVKKIGDPRLSYQTLIEGGESNFNAKLNGYRTESGTSRRKDEYGYFWTNTPTQFPKTAFIVGFAKTSNSGMTLLDQYNKKDALSCRCIKD
jgi:uncharacterized protein (TIGR02145 family)